MNFEFTLLTNPPYIDLPQGLVGWLGWFLLLGLLLSLFYQLNGTDRSRSRKIPASWRRGFFVALLFLIPFTSLLLIVRLPAGNALPPLGRPIEPLGPALVFFAMLPVFLAAGILNSIQTLVVGFLIGVFITFWETHSSFSLLEYPLIGLVLYWCFQQNYRTSLYKLLRSPIPAAILLALIYPLINVYSTVFLAQGSLATRLDYAFTRLPYSALAFAGELIIASLFATLVPLAIPRAWGNAAPLRPSPAERSLSARILFNLAPLMAALLVALMIVSWIVAGNIAQQMLRNRMENAAQTAASVIPFFMETGQNLIQQMSRDPRWFTTNPEKQLLALQICALCHILPNSFSWTLKQKTLPATPSWIMMQHLLLLKNKKVFGLLWLACHSKLMPFHPWKASKPLKYPLSPLYMMRVLSRSREF